jgi:hypothetical protein
VLLSLRVATVRQVQQGLGMVIFVVGFVPGMLIQVLPPEWKVVLADWVSTVDTSTLVLVVAAILAVLDAVLLGVTLTRFRRARLLTL